MSEETDNIGSNELSEEDINRLIKSPFERKMEITKKIADYYKSGGFNETDMVTAARIFGTLVKDTEVKIRSALSQAIKDHPNIPKDMILSLAHDVQEVALPVLQFSEVLTDSDLIEIVNSTRDVEKQKSISKREMVSENLSEALIETHNEEVVGTLLQNEGASLSADNLDQIVEEFGDKEDVMASMVERTSLPMSIVESLADKISETIYSKLQERNPDAFARMDEVVKRSRDVATMKVMGLRSSDSEYYQFCQLMDKLKITDELSPIYALCMGNIGIFEIKAARITQTPVLNIRKLLMDSSNKGFRVIYDRANLPPDLKEATEVLITALRKVTDEYAGKIRNEGVTKEIASKLTEYILREVKDVDAIKNLDYILSLVGHYASSDSDLPLSE